MATKKAAFDAKGVKFTKRAVPVSQRSQYRLVAEKLAQEPEGTCVENLPGKGAANSVAMYLREVGCKTRMAEVKGVGWCVWQRGPLTPKAKKK